MILNFELLSLKNHANENELKIEKAYACWKEIWIHTFLELGVIKNEKDLASDAFLRLDEVGLLKSQKENFVGVIGFRQLDLSKERFKDDSYLKKWHECGVFRDYKDETVLTAGQLGLIESFKGSLPYKQAFMTAKGQPISPRDVMVGLCVMRLLNSPCRYMLATPRLDRGVGQASNSWGGVSRVRDVPSGYGDLIDLIVFDKQNLGPIQKNLGYEMAFNLYHHQTETRRKNEKVKKAS